MWWLMAQKLSREQSRKKKMQQQDNRRRGETAQIFRARAREIEPR